MTETSTVDETSDTALPPLTQGAYLGADGTADDTPLKSRLLLPLVVPLLSIAIVAVVVLNISRVLLAGDEDSALVIAIVLTVTIMIGASLIAAAPRLRTSSLAVILFAIFVLVSGAGLVTLGPSLNDGEAVASGYVRPTGKPVGTVSVNAGPGYTFDGVANTMNYDAPQGVVEIDYGGASGHTLAIQNNPKFDGFVLTSDAGGPNKGNVQLTPGKYTIYCTVTGHEGLGMKATITVAG